MPAFFLVSGNEVSYSISALAVSDNQVLGSILEDLTTPYGKLVSNIFLASYINFDNNKLIGVIVTSNLSQSSEGEWQWSSEGSAGIV